MNRLLLVPPAFAFQLAELSIMNRMFGLIPVPACAALYRSMSAACVTGPITAMVKTELSKAYFIASLSRVLGAAIRYHPNRHALMQNRSRPLSRLHGGDYTPNCVFRGELVQRRISFGGSRPQTGRRGHLHLRTVYVHRLRNRGHIVLGYVAQNPFDRLLRRRFRLLLRAHVVDDSQINNAGVEGRDRQQGNDQQQQQTHHQYHPVLLSALVDHGYSLLVAGLIARATVLNR